jgi:hypothetical protein
LTNNITTAPVLCSVELRDPSGRLAAAAHFTDVEAKGYRVGTEVPVDECEALARQGAPGRFVIL